MDSTVQIRQRGTLALPVDVRERYGIQPGDTFRLFDLDGIFILTPIMTTVPELAREIERARVEAGLSTEELLAGLSEQRERYLQETLSATSPPRRQRTMSGNCQLPSTQALPQGMPADGSWYGHAPPDSMIARLPSRHVKTHHA